MLCLYLDETDPYFCLAAEEYLLKHYTEDIFMLWQSFDTVVTGKHQNAMAEIDYRYTRENGIRVARRISGGGTVYHDRGNVNFTFIKNVHHPQEVSFRTFTEPIIEVLKELGVHAETSGRNDLIVNGKKISGNAEHIYKNRVLHHGTLLFDSDLQRLRNAIRVKPGKYAGKAVASIRSEVSNIADFLSESLSLEEFIRYLIKHQLDRSRDNILFRIPETDQKNIHHLSEQKFAAWEWQFGYSPDYTFSNSVIMDEKQLHIELAVKKGVIVSAHIRGNYYSPEQSARLEALLLNKAHRYEEVEGVHKELGLPVEEDLMYSYF